LDEQLVATEIASTADPIFYAADSTLLLNKISTLGNSEIAEYHRVFSYDKVLTQSEVLTMYDEAQPGYIPPPTPPTPPINLTIPDLHWDYETFYDNQNAVEFTNYNVDIVDEKAVIDASTDFLLAFIPSALVSKFSISLIFNFKALNSGDPINFIFSTYTGFPTRREGIMLRVIDGNIEFELHGKNGPSPNYSTNTLYRINEPITGFPGVIFDEFCNLAITFDHNTKIIKTYINGSLNSSTNALVSGVNIKDIQLGTNFGGNANVNFNINKWVDASYGLNELDDFKFFNSVLTDEEITYYYDEINPSPTPPPPPPTVVGIDQKLFVESADHASVDAVLAGVLQMTTTFQINISAINNPSRFMHISGPPTGPLGRMGRIEVVGQSATTISIKIVMHYHYRGFRSASFNINKNELITLGYTMEADGKLRIFYNGALVGDGGSFYQESMPLSPFVRIFDDMDIIKNISCLLGDVAYYKVQKSDAFMQDIDNYYIKPADTELIFGWKQGTFIDVVNSIPISIV
jgi:hypothetical protein